MDKDYLEAMLEECDEELRRLAGIRAHLAELRTVADELERDAMADRFHDVPPRLRELQRQTEDFSDALQDLRPSLDRVVAVGRACQDEEASLTSPNADRQYRLLINTRCVHGCADV